MKLKYIGNGNFIPGVPAKDIEVDAKEGKRLIKTGLYEEIEPDKEADK